MKSWVDFNIEVLKRHYPVKGNTKEDTITPLLDMYNDSVSIGSYILLDIVFNLTPCQDLHLHNIKTDKKLHIKSGYLLEDIDLQQINTKQTLKNWLEYFVHRDHENYLIHANPSRDDRDKLIESNFLYITEEECKEYLSRCRYRETIMGEYNCPEDLIPY